MKKTFQNHEYKPQNKLWKQIREFAAGIMPSAASRQRRNFSTYQFPCTSFRKLLFQNNRGIALITVILIVGILVAVVIELNRSSRADIYDAANLSDGIKLTYIAKSGFYGAAALLANPALSLLRTRDPRSGSLRWRSDFGNCPDFRSANALLVPTGK